MILASPRRSDRPIRLTPRSKGLSGFVVWLALGLAACSPRAVESGCTEDLDCQEEAVCLDGRCLQRCSIDDDCLYRRDRCVAGVCREASEDAGAADDSGAEQDASVDGGESDAIGADAGGDDAWSRDALVDEAGIADVAAPDSSAADTAVADAAAPDTSLPDSAAPDTYAPDTAPIDNFCQGGDVVLRETLQGASGGTRRGGQLGAEGWTTQSSSDQITWDLGEVVGSGSLSFEARGFHHDVGGCFWGVCYYVGLFEESNGDKQADYTGSAFIESRYHNDQQENFHDTFKLQAGDGSGAMQEPMMPEGIGWAPSEWHRFRIEWGGGESRFYIDGSQKLTARYSTSRAIAWRYLFLGTTNYKGVGWAATGVTYRKLCLRR